ncbi:PEP-CTERM sorting domain-containing protein [Paucibacter sp. DJ4R-1]|nr:PEP-CTERM sorting domain-containing protein [Paucibacter sp. DJ4R-1]
MLIKKLVVVLGLISGSFEAAATTYTAVFKPLSPVGSNAALSATELAYRYEVIFNFDAPGQVAGVGVPSDTALAHYFFADVKTNNFTMQVPPASNDPSNQFGVWDQQPNGNQTVWGSGGTYGGFTYKTRLSLITGNNTDYTSIFGFWGELMPSASIENFQRSDNMLWMIYDTSRWPNGSEYQGSYFATLESVTAAVPEPSQVLMLLAGFAALGIRRRLTRGITPQHVE